MIQRIIALGDTHCGQVAGLTPPSWRINPGAHPVSFQLQEQAWAAYLKLISDHGPFDVALVNGDLLDGRGEASGGSELMTSDMLEQVDMAIACLEPIKPRNGWAFTYGTAYHTGKKTDYEKGVARHYSAPIESQMWPEIEGVIFDMKHHLGSSGLPHGRHTAIAKEKLWNMLWHERDEQPKGKVFLRSHVHYHQYAGDADWLGMTLPALQQADTKYGGRRCSGTVDWGAVIFEVENGRVLSWKPIITRYQDPRSETFKL